METQHLLVKALQHRRVPRPAGEKGARIAQHAGDVPHDLVRRAHSGRGPKARIAVWRVADRLLDAVGQGGEEMAKHLAFVVHRVRPPVSLPRTLYHIWAYERMFAP